MTLSDVQDAVAGHMDEIATYFKKGALVTVIVRFPEFPTRDFIMTADKIEELTAMIERRAQAEKRTGIR